MSKSGITRTHKRVPQAVIVAAIKRCGGVNEFAAVAGVRPTTVNRWLLGGRAQKGNLAKIKSIASTGTMQLELDLDNKNDVRTVSVDGVKVAGRKGQEIVINGVKITF